MPDALHRLFAAAQSFGRDVLSGVTIGNIILKDTAGNTVLMVRVPSCDCQAAEQLPSGDSPATSGWDFSRDGASFGGVRVRVQGGVLMILRAIAAAPGPVKIPDLLEVFETTGYTTNEPSIRVRIGLLRKALAQAFPDAADTVRESSEGFSLMIR